MGASKEDLVSKATAEAKNLQVQQIEDIASAWMKFDADGNEIISTGEVVQFLQELAISMPQEEIDSLVADLDKNGNGTISFIEFVIAYNNGLFEKFLA